MDVGSLFGRAMDEMMNGQGDPAAAERERTLTPFTYEWHERMLAQEKADKAQRAGEFL